MLKKILLILIIVGLDQWTKQWAMHQEPMMVTSFMNIVTTYNSGITFGFAQHINIGLLLTAMVPVLVFIVAQAFFYGMSRMENIGYSLILAGAIGNIIDRLHHGFVIDFLDFHYGSWHWWTFNIADSAIMLGVMLLLTKKVFCKP